MSTEEQEAAHHGLEYTIAAIGFFLELASLFWHGYAFAIGAASFFFLAAYEYTKRWLNGMAKSRRYTLRLAGGIVITLIMLLFPYLKTRTGTKALTASQPSMAELTTDPVIHIEPEDSLTWSSTPGHVTGLYQLTISSTSHDIDHVEVQNKFFVAERSESDLVFKDLGGAPQESSHPGVLKRGDHFVFWADFRPYAELAKRLMIEFNGPSLFGVKVLVHYRRSADGKPYTFWKGYAAINPLATGIYDADSSRDFEAKENPGKCPGVHFFWDGFSWQSDALNQDEFRSFRSTLKLPPCGRKAAGHFLIPPKGRLRLRDLEFYMNMPGHWVPVVHEYPSGKVY